MGLLDDLFFNAGPEIPSLAGRRARKVLREPEYGVDEARLPERVLPPDYARPLVVRGAVLPAALDRDGARVRIGWERAAGGACARRRGPARQVDRAWKARTMTAEWGTRYGALFEATMKQRKKERRRR